MELRVEVLGRDQTVRWKQFTWNAVPRVGDGLELGGAIAPVVEVRWLPTVAGRVRVRVDARSLEQAAFDTATSGWGG